MLRNCMCNCKQIYNYSPINSTSNNCKDSIFDDTCSCLKNNSCSDCNEPCHCGFDEEDDVFPRNYMFGQSYVPMQRMNNTFIPSVGLKMGTIFPELVSPYEPCQSMQEINYIRATNTIGEGCNKC